MLAPLAFHPLAGVTVPPIPAAIVKKYWMLNFAAYVVLVLGATVCEIAPLSLQLAHTY